ncbi:MAG: CxxxxCH/CxxCH domain-containing protein, partial [Desulfuromonadales bacterium]|nr:CxxxxCH/CxxCH domain-containing protein [Desulfuromonadales bacterium]
MWQRMDGSNVPEVGAQEPTTYARQFNGRYGFSRGKLVCFRCHDPHADATRKASLLKVPVDADQICSDCHLPWYQNNAHALLTHPVGSGVIYNTAAADATKFNASITNVNNGEIRKVAGFVSCTSCHGVHSVDSNSATVDGYANYNSLSGDGHQLRSDGPRDLAAVTEADFTVAEAQLKSNLCQACHVYKLHGKVDDGAADRFLGCLDCHSGHAYNDNDPYYFVLRKNSYNPMTNSSVSLTGYNFGGFDYIYNNPDIFSLLNRTEVWKDNSNLTALGYCEACHGEAETIPKGALFHSSTDDCATCHLHNSTGWAYSFQNDASAATCGDCHGFPPYKNQPGDRTGSGVDGGYAYISAAWNYANASVTYFKDESTTPHNAHAAGGTTQGATSDYIFGNGVYACEPCHENYVPTHQQEATLPYTTGFRDINFYANVDQAGATYNSVTSQCSALYCHSNGAPRTGDGPTRNYATGTVTTPAWDNGKGTIIGKTTPTHECAFCHGNSATTMNTKGNSAAHAKHLDRYGDDCSICHNQTAVNSTTLASGANRIDLLSPASGGKHVNTLYDIVYKSSGSVLYNALGTNAVGLNYNSTTGTCSVYCHDPADLGTTADWDSGVGGAACGSCHGVTAATLTTNSHAIHLDPAGANISCDECHGAGASTAVHAGHVDGVVTQLTVAASCDLCHGVEGADTSPIWGNSGSIDCLTCHTGASVTSYTDASAATVTAPAKTMAAISGHNRPTASNAYPVTGSPAANKTCTTCHLTAIDADHVGGAATKLLQVAFACEDCHTAAGSRSAEATLRVLTHSNMDAVYTGQKRLDFAALCTACHDPHGAGSNIAMIGEVKADFLASVVLYNVIGADSFDEADAANGDDICATCHTATVHNNQAASGTHHEGENCLTCHGHNGVNGGFMPTGGTACNDCHGNPPTASDDRPAGKAGVHAAHVNVASHEESEDKFDCEVCHPGAATFTLSHSDASVSLAAGITNGTCASACHLSITGDGNWTDINGLNCDACHYWNATPTSAGNVASGNREAISATHNKHFDKGKLCVNCHTNNATDTVAPRTHITDHEAWALNVTNDGTILTDRGNATQEEATVDFTLATTKYASWNDGTNSCGTATANSGLGCHATGSPTWGGAALACIDCHTDKSSSAVNPTSGLHSATPLVSGIQHNESFLYNSGVSTGNCETCHTSVPSSGHQDGVMDATRGAVGNLKITFAATISYTDDVAPTCAPSLTGCHYEQPTKTVDWKRKWHEGAANATASCAGCHGDWVNGWNTDVQHHTNAKAQSTHGTKAGKTYECMDCHALEATAAVYPFTLGSNDWKPTDAAATTLHGNGVINVNSTGTGFVRVSTLSGCPDCHTNWQTDGKHAYDVTEWTLTTIAGDAPTVTCATCHGGLTVGANATNYWPDKVGNDATEDNGGRHLIHMTRLAQAKYGETITALLTDNANGTADAKQKYLCAYCHTAPGSDFDHGDAATLPAEVFVSNAVRSSKTMWDTADSDATYTSGNCSSVECHNGKATATTATFDWYGAGTQNCALCHNDITVTTAATTGATHDAHVGTPITAFGKAIGCASCHGGSPTWSPYVVPSSGHINGAFAVSGGSVTVSYTGTYTNAATRTVGTCGTNLCHNNGKNAATPVYTWQTAIAGCAACHATSVTLGSSHDPHMNASFATTFGRAVVGCEECHDAVSASSMSGKTAHMDGSVTLNAGITYTGTPATLTVGGTNTYGTCSASLCHQNGKGANVASPAWNRTASSTDNCTICHNDGSGAPQPATGRHAKHVTNAAYVTSSCGSCHANATATTIGGTTHINATANTGVSITVHTAGTAGCTNNCHLVNEATSGDWLDSNILACLECHVTGKVGAALLPTSGLHAVIARVSGKTHDATLHASGCEACHTTIRTQTTTHIKGSVVADGASNTDRGLFAAYTDAATGSCMGTGVNLAAGCHRDNGDWGRKWATTVVNSDGAECGNCHGGIGVGYAVASWTAGIIPDHTIDRGDVDTTPEVMTSHSVCKSCHGFNGAADKDANYDLTNLWNQGGVDTSMHGNSKITMNGGTNYNAANWGCDNAGCHSTAADGHALADSAWTVELGAFAAGGDCWGCHGNGTSQYWPDGTVYPDRAGVHVEHIVAIVAHMAGGDTLANRNATCIYCHPGGAHSGDQAAAPADVSNTDTNNDDVADLNIAAKMKKIVGAADDNSGFYRSTPTTCSTVACHASAPFTPHWYTDTVAPGDVTLTAAAGPVPRSIKLTWTAVGDDGTLDGTAYKYDIRMGTTSAIAIDFGLATNHVQGVPTVKRMGAAQEAIIHGVDPSTTYYFALRTYDVTGNFGGTANVDGYVSYLVPASPDTTPPVLTGSPSWYGLDSAKALDAAGTVALSWTRAEDHSMPITYDIWWSTGTITYGAPQASTGDTHFRATGLSDGQTYNFAVRARDAYGNTDTNTIVLQAIPQGLSTVPKTNVNYYADGTATSNMPLLDTVHTTDGTTAALPAVFIGPTTFTATTDIFASGFSLNIVNSNVVTTLQAELGYITGASSTFNSFSTALLASDQTVAKRATRLVTFKFNGAQRQMTEAMNAKLGVQVSVTVGAVTSIGWGPTSKGGILSFATQPINTSPTAPTVSSTVSGANASIWWAASTDIADGVADTVHYDVYGSANGGADGFPYIIATGLTTNATVGAPLVWDTQAAGIALGAAVSNVQVRVEAGDVINGKVLSHTVATSSNLAVDNSGDNVAPGAIAHFKAETRPKQGSVYLSWTAPGDDGANNGRAAAYDIRLAAAIIDTGIKYNAATQLDSEPYPDFGGNGQGYEVLDLAEGTYFFAIKAFDEGGNASPLAYTAATVDAGPKCGICHSTPPDETATIGNHARHGYTITECANCHGSEAANFTTSHQDGAIKLGWKTASPVVATIYNSGYIYTYNSLVIYKDADGSGGFNATGDNMDDGSCGNWSTLNVSGCHGPAVSATWTDAATLSCSACHGDDSRVLDQYSHSFDDPSDDVKAAPPVDNHGYDGTGATEAERKYVGAHVAHLNSSFRMSKGDSCRLCHGASRPGNSIHADGIIDVDLDLAAAGASAVWTEGTPTTAGSCSSMDPGACHPSTAAPTWDSAAVFYCTNCHGMGGATPSHVTDPIGSNIDLPDNDLDSGDPMPGNCTWCHVGGHPKDKKVIAITNASPAVVTTEHNHNLAGGEKVSIHTTTGMTEINNHTYNTAVINATQFSLVGSDTSGYGTFDNGSWIEGNGTGIILIPNDSRVGINYLSGGVHLKANIGARGEVSSEAELCWSCHTPNNISEWGADDGSTNTATDPGNGNVYNFGTLNQPNWIGATWTSGTTGTYGFGYKTNTIRSTHSTDATGTSALTGSAYAYTNGGVDAVGKIHCSNCHDVHNSNTSPLAGDSLDPTGPPYLRGTWKSNPYKEDGAPILGQTYLDVTVSTETGYGYGMVPRASSSTSNAMGGYWIDQNSGNPTAGWTYESSAALCQLCHSTTVDTLDHTTGENLWITTANGHANSVLGGSGTGAANIFRTGFDVNGVGRQGTGGVDEANPNPGGWMGFQNTQATAKTGDDDYGYGPRSAKGPYLTPLQKSQVSTPLLMFAWGNSVDATTVESGYHQFSCSKCHNPHASRLPKLMITNCLDVTHNTWDNSYDAENDPTWADNGFSSVASSWGTKRLSHLSTAQNCHRMIDLDG